MTTSKVTLVIDSADATGTLLTRGAVRIIPSQRVSDTADGVLVETAAVRVQFTGCGTAPSVDLFPSDLIGPQSGGSPEWSYTVYYDGCPGNPQPWSFHLLSTDGATQRLSSLTAL
jgi:hypothetical protein